MTKLKSNYKITGLGIVPEELTEDNFEIWKNCLKNYLVGNGLWGVVSGKETEPYKNDRDEHEEWEKKNALALHAIQLSCGTAFYSKFKDSKISAHYAWSHLAERAWRMSRQLAPILDHDEERAAEDSGSREYLKYMTLYEAVEENNWHATQDFLQDNPQAIRAIVTSHGDTALHVATLSGHTKIAAQLVQLMNPEDLEMINEYGATALSLAAIHGAKELAKAMVRKNKNLVTIANVDRELGQLPVIVAALYGQKEIVRYLYGVTPKDELSPEKGENGATLLNSLITAEIYDVASMLWTMYPKLGVTPDHNGHYALRSLANKPYAFPSGTKLAFWQTCIYNCIRVHSPWDIHQGSHDKDRSEMQTSSVIDDHNIQIQESSDEEMRHGGLDITTRALGLLSKIGWWILLCLVPDIEYLYQRKLVHVEVVKFLKVAFQEVLNLSKPELEKMDIHKIILDAIKHGILEFIEELIKCKPEIIWTRDNKGRTIFSHAIVLRQEKIFSLIYSLGAKKQIMAMSHDNFKNNYLHLAAKLSPPSRLEGLCGTALQMQRELQWFQEVERIVQPQLKEEANVINKTPEILFREEHEKLAKEAEIWMKNTAESSMIVGTLIAVVIFTTTFTVPGGIKNDTGTPTMLETQKIPFMIFSISNALSMISSTMSLLMLLGILTERYAVVDFFRSLPVKLIFGLMCLFFSIVTMMASFGSALYLILHELSWVTIPIIVFSIIPTFLFTMVQLPLLLEMTYRTYGPGIFDNPEKKFRFCHVPSLF